MSSQLLFDKLAYIDRLKAAGVDEKQARAHAEGLDQALREEVATKSDIAKLETKIEKAKNAILITIITVSFALLGAIFALQRVFPPG